MDYYERLAAQEEMDAENELRPSCPECGADGFTELCHRCWNRLGGGI